MKRYFYIVFVFLLTFLGMFFFFSYKESLNSQEKIASSLKEESEETIVIKKEQEHFKKEGMRSQEHLNIQEEKNQEIQAKNFEENILPQMRVLIETDLLSKEKKEEQKEWFSSEEKLLKIFESLSLYSDDYEKNSSEGENEFYFYKISGRIPTKGEFIRMKSVEFISQAIRFKDNIKKDFIKEKIKENLLSDYILESYPKYVQRAMLGDKIELVSILLQEYPHEYDFVFNVNDDGKSEFFKKQMSVIKKFIDHKYSYEY